MKSEATAHGGQWRRSWCPLLGGLIALSAALGVALLWRQPFVVLSIGLGALLPVLVR